MSRTVMKAMPRTAVTLTPARIMCILDSAFLNFFLRRLYPWDFTDTTDEQPLASIKMIVQDEGQQVAVAPEADL